MALAAWVAGTLVGTVPIHDELIEGLTPSSVRAPKVNEGVDHFKEKYAEKKESHHPTKTYRCSPEASPGESVIIAESRGKGRQAGYRTQEEDEPN